MRAMQPYEQGCACFRLCSEYDARAFHLRLPVVTTRESPWYHYLSFVYLRTHVPLPVNLSNFEFFYLQLLPVDWRCNGTDANRSRPTCTPDVCSAWLRSDEPTTSALESHNQRWHLRSWQWHRRRFPRLLMNLTLRYIPRTPPVNIYRGATRIEVTRHAGPFAAYLSGCARGHGATDDFVGDPLRGAGEGMGYGCWFSPSIGTGVFLPIGRALLFSDRQSVEERFPDMAIRFADRPQSYATSVQVSGRDSATYRHRDCLYANATMAAGYTRMVIASNPGGSTEIVVASAGCLHQTQPLQSACVPEDVGLRAGWDGALRHCACSEEKQDGLDRMLNCLGTQPQQLDLP